MLGTVKKEPKITEADLFEVKGAFQILLDARPEKLSLKRALFSLDFLNKGMYPTLNQK